MTPRSTNPPLSRDQVYNDLNGEECLAILTQRLSALLATCPMFVKHLTLPRVKMTTTITLEIFECEPPIRTLSEVVVVRSPGPAGESPSTQPHIYDASDLVDSFNNPPDQIREENGLPIATPTRHPMTKQTVDVMVSTRPPAAAPGTDPDEPQIHQPHPDSFLAKPLLKGPPVVDGEVKVTLDRGGAASRFGVQPYQTLPGANELADRARAGPDRMPIQSDFADGVLKKK